MRVIRFKRKGRDWWVVNGVFIVPTLGIALELLGK